MARIQRDLPTYRRQGTWKKVLRNALGFLVCLYLGLMVVEGLFIRGFVPRSESMEPGIESGDRLLLSPLLYGKVFPFSDSAWLDLSSPARGDLVMVRPPYFMDLSGLEKIADSIQRTVLLNRKQVHPDRNMSKLWESSPVLRRVIGVPGDEVLYSAGTFMVKRKGEKNWQTEYLASGKKYAVRLPKELILDTTYFLADQSGAITVPEGELYVACDNRTGFLDSRHWSMVRREDLRGQVLLRIWPLGRFGLIQ